MLAILMLNRMSSRRAAAKRRAVKKPVKKPAAKPVKSEPRSSEDCCRTCLGGDDLMAIFSSKEVEEKRSEELKLVTGLDIKMNDGLSQKICSGCLSTMNIALLFRRTSHNAEQSLMSMLTDNHTDVTQQKVEVEYEDYSCNYDLFGEDIHNNCEYGQEAVNPISKQKTPSASKRKRSSIPNSSSYQCPECGKVFRMKATFKAHLRFHTNFCVCESCGKRCRNNNQLQEHKRARHGLGKIHKCAYCEYSSATKEALTIHERRHTGERPYVCDHCGATFHRRSNLVQHIAIHNPEKNFQCGTCGKRVSSRKFLQIHVHNAHTGRRYGYLCPVCRHRFEKPNKVRAHMRRVHAVSDDQGPICSVCLKREKSRKLLAIHEHKYHKENRYRYICPICKDSFTRPGNVRQHLVRSHSIPRDDQGPIPRYEMALPKLPVSFSEENVVEEHNCGEDFIVPYLEVLQ